MRRIAVGAIAALVGALSLVGTASTPAAAEDYGGDCQLSVSVVSAHPGDTVPVQGAGFQPLVTVELRLLPLLSQLPVAVVDVTIASDGTFVGYITIPEDMQIGTYVLIIPCGNLLSGIATTLIIVTPDLIPVFNLTIKPLQPPFIFWGFGGQQQAAQQAAQGASNQSTTASPVVTVSQAKVSPLERFTALVRGALPGSVVAFAGGDGSVLGRSVADGNGVARLVTAFPSTAAGRQLIRASGIGADNEPFSSVDPVEIVATSDAPDGSDATPWAVASTAFALLGAGAATAIRRRSHHAA